MTLMCVLLLVYSLLTTAAVLYLSGFRVVRIHASLNDLTWYLRQYWGFTEVQCQQVQRDYMNEKFRMEFKEEDK